jgi:hypothetical protein
MTEEQINHALRQRYGCRSEDINDPRYHAELSILDALYRGPSWLEFTHYSERLICARFRLILSGQIEQDPNGWRLSKTCGETANCDTISAETGPTKPKE